MPLDGIPNGASLLERNWVETISIPVEITSLDDFARSSDLAPVQLIKIDTEGTEHEVIRGSSWLIERDRPTIIAEVLHQLPAEKELGPQLAALGYRAWHMTQRGLRPMEAVEGDPAYVDLNYLFVPEEKEENVLSVLAKSVPILP